MRRGAVLLVLLALAASASGCCRFRVCYPKTFEGGEFNLDFPHVPGQLLVGWRTAPRILGPRDPLWRDQAQLIASVGGRELYRIRFDQTSVIELRRSADEDLRREGRALLGSPLVVDVSANTLIFFDQDTASYDPLFDEQWALESIDAAGAWEHTEGSRDVIVAVVDSGLEIAHEDLRANLWVHPCEDLDGDGQIVASEANGIHDGCDGEISVHPDDFFGWNFRDDDDQVSDESAPHGSHVAGIIGAVGGNGVGVNGVNWQIRLMALKVGNATIGQVAHAIQGIDYAVEHGAHVVNLSWSTADVPDLENALVDAGEAGVFVVAAAGHARSGYENLEIFPAWPASYDLDHVVAVAATSASDDLSSESKYGVATVELGAPGVDVVSTLSSSYVTRSGTSMAAPHVAGVAALIRSLRPEVTTAEIRECLMHGDPVAALAGKTIEGERLNARRAVEACLDEDGDTLGTPGTPELITP